MSEKVSVKSPCVHVCNLNDNDICEGCYRSADEIAQWVELTDENKRDVLLKSRKRFRELNKYILL